ncbi:CinA family protein [Parvularcula sp. ZS-1/3]|uniref:CinA family protein n=1 Tax=Parvularcula mediterranea TaxID=2732508 RepID=A0A7Y3W3U5_9PROT|nr:CinA family protein [Parvularcula mediterranea]NNU14814.1 CinA family protein [Parvularcula mediterranea]
MTDRQSIALVDEIIARASTEGLTIATAESCTGGMISSALTSVPGSSAAFTFGFVTYANGAKTSLLGVSEDILDEHGAVSREVAFDMAFGARQRASADIAVSVTGVAGPGGGTDEKPVGLVWFGLSGSFGTITERRVFPAGSRDFIRMQAARTALRLILRGIELSV